MGVNLDIKDADKLLYKIPFKSILFVITSISGLFLFLTDNILEKLFLIDLRNAVGTYLGTVFIICLSIWCVIIFNMILKAIKKATIFSDKNCKKRFEKISKEGLELILEMYHSESRTMQLDMTEATVVVLEELIFIGRGSISVGGMEFDYFLQPWVVKYLDKHISEYSNVTIMRKHHK